MLHEAVSFVPIMANASGNGTPRQHMGKHIELQRGFQ